MMWIIIALITGFTIGAIVGIYLMADVVRYLRGDGAVLGKFYKWLENFNQ